MHEVLPEKESPEPDPVSEPPQSESESRSETIPESGPEIETVRAYREYLAKEMPPPGAKDAYIPKIHFGANPDHQNRTSSQTKQKNNCVNSVFNGITITIDMIDDNPDTIRLFALRSFGESLYHSITDACLEFGYKSL